MNDRVPTRPNRVKVTHENGSVEYITWERADEPLQEGTPLNKANLFSGDVENRYGASTPSAGFEKLVQSFECIVAASGWSSQPNADGFYTNTVQIAGMKSVYTPLYSLNDTSASTLDTTADAFSQVKRMVTYDGYVVFMSLERIDTDIPVMIKGV